MNLIAVILNVSCIYRRNWKTALKIANSTVNILQQICLIEIFTQFMGIFHKIPSAVNHQILNFKHIFGKFHTIFNNLYFKSRFLYFHIFPDGSEDISRTVYPFCLQISGNVIGILVQPAYGFPLSIPKIEL